MAELAGPRKARSNPLYDDLVLFDMYMRALDRVMANSEIRAGLDEFRFSPQTLRGRMITGARQVLKAAPREFAAYELVLGRLGSARGPEVQAPIPRPADHPLHTMRLLCRGLAAGGLLLAVAGVASIPLWPWTEPLLWAGASTLAAAGILYSVPWLAAVLGLRLLTGEAALDFTGHAPDLQDTLDGIIRSLTPGAHAMNIVNLACQPIIGQPAALTSVQLDFAAYAYYCATLQDVFTEELGTARIIKATSTSPDPGTFDALAAARQAFSLDTHLAWQSITQFRQAWSLETREPPEGNDE